MHHRDVTSAQTVAQAHTRKISKIAGILGVLAACAAAAPTEARHVEGCHTRSCDIRVKRKCMASTACRTRVIHKQWHRTADPYWGTFNAIASCESHGDWHIDTGNGYYGGIQFALTSWYAVGGRGNPAHATKLEQIYRGVLLMRKQGWGAWPVCRRAAGV